MSTLKMSSTETAADALDLIDVDHVRFFVGNAKQSAFFYAMTFGFRIHQVADLTSGSRDRARYLLTQGNIRFILETPLNKDDPAADELRRFGDGVKDVAFTVENAQAAWKQAVANGGVSAYEPLTISDEHGSVTTAGIKTYGRAVHSFVSRTGAYAIDRVKQGSLFEPGYRVIDGLALNEYNEKNPCGLMFVDHCVGNVEEGRMNDWVQWYEDVMGFAMFKHFDDEDISTEHSALMSKVMASGNNLIKMPINEPADGLEEEPDPGVSGVARHDGGRAASRRCAAMTRLGRSRSCVVVASTFCAFRRPTTRRSGSPVEKTLADHGQEAVKEDYDRIRDLGILVDADDEGYLLQLFTMPLQDRPTLFFEIICRRGSQSFGKGNFKALFEALEMEQERRGNL